MAAAQRIIFDTNILLAIVRNNLDVFEAITQVTDSTYLICVLEATVQELEQLHSTLRGKEKFAANLALQILAQYAQQKKIQILADEGYVDDLLVKYSTQGDLVVTLDKELKSRLTRPYATLRQGKYFILID